MTLCNRASSPQLSIWGSAGGVYSPSRKQRDCTGSLRPSRASPRPVFSWPAGVPLLCKVAQSSFNPSLSWSHREALARPWRSAGVPSATQMLIIGFHPPEDNRYHSAFFKRLITGASWILTRFGRPPGPVLASACRWEEPRLQLDSWNLVAVEQAAAPSSPGPLGGAPDWWIGLFSCVRIAFF